MTEKLFKYYSLDECINRKKVLIQLRTLRDEGKIDYNIEVDLLKLDDIDLDDMEIVMLCDLFDDNYVIPYLDKQDDDDFYDGWDDGEDIDEKDDY